MGRARNTAGFHGIAYIVCGCQLLDIIGQAGRTDAEGHDDRVAGDVLEAGRDLTGEKLHVEYWWLD